MASLGADVPDRMLTMRLRWWVVLLAAISCARRGPDPISQIPVVREAPPLELRQRYGGTYQFVGGDAERAAVAAAVDRVVARMSFLARGIARSSLIERAEIREAIGIFFADDGTVTVLSPGELPESSPADGAPVRVVNRFGDKSELSQQFINGVFVQRGRTDDGSGSTVFELRPDGQTLLVHRTMESSKLPQPVKYTLTYRRTP